MRIDVAKDFTDTPGVRYRNQSAFSGEEFREELLDPGYCESKKLGEKLIVNLDGAYGYPPSFLEEAFGGLARTHIEDSASEIISMIEIISFDAPYRIAKIKEYIIHGNDDR